MSDWIWLKGILMSHSIEQVLNKVTVWCEQSSLSELVTFDLSYKRISKCKTWVKTWRIQLLLQKLISNSDALAHFWGQVGNCVWRQHRQLKFHPLPPPSPPSTPHSSTVGWSMAAAGGSNSANMSQPSSSVWADRPTLPGIWAPADLVCWSATICLIFFLGFKKSYSILAQKDKTKLKRTRLWN